jgi:hypothetical protein
MHSVNEYGLYYVCDGCLSECGIMEFKDNEHKDMKDAEIFTRLIL